MSGARLRADRPVLEIGGIALDRELVTCELVPQTSNADTLCQPWKTEISDWKFEIEAVQNTANNTLWRMHWDTPHAELPFVFKPHGARPPSEDFPHLVGTLRLANKPPIGGAAALNVSFIFLAVLSVTSGPNLITN